MRAAHCLGAYRKRVRSDYFFVRVARREFEQSVLIPTELVSALSEHSAESYQAWTVARPANDFATMRPILEKTLDLSRRIAECFPDRESIADPLIAFSDYGMKASSVRAVFDELVEIDDRTPIAFIE